MLNLFITFFMLSELFLVMLIAAIVISTLISKEKTIGLSTLGDRVFQIFVFFLLAVTLALPIFLICSYRTADLSHIESSQLAWILLAFTVGIDTISGSRLLVKNSFHHPSAALDYVIAPIILTAGSAALALGCMIVLLFVHV